MQEENAEQARLCTTDDYAEGVPVRAGAEIQRCEIAFACNWCVRSSGAEQKLREMTQGPAMRQALCHVQNQYVKFRTVTVPAVSLMACSWEPYSKPAIVGRSAAGSGPESTPSMTVWSSAL